MFDKKTLEIHLVLVLPPKECKQELSVPVSEEPIDKAMASIKWLEKLFKEVKEK